jgi:hypothetical protein
MFTKDKYNGPCRMSYGQFSYTITIHRNKVVIQQEPLLK